MATPNRGITTMMRRNPKPCTKAPRTFSYRRSMRVAPQLLFPARSAISCCNIMTYSVLASINAAEICQNGIDSKLSAPRWMISVNDWRLQVFDWKLRVVDSRLQFLKIGALLRRFEPSGRRQGATDRRREISDRQPKALSRLSEPSIFENRSFQLAIGDFKSRARSIQSIARDDQTVLSCDRFVRHGSLRIDRGSERERRFFAGHSGTLSERSRTSRPIPAGSNSPTSSNNPGGKDGPISDQRSRSGFSSRHDGIWPVGAPRTLP